MSQDDRKWCKQERWAERWTEGWTVTGDFLFSCPLVRWKPTHCCGSGLLPGCAWIWGWFPRAWPAAVHLHQSSCPGPGTLRPAPDLMEKTPELNQMATKIQLHAGSWNILAGEDVQWCNCTTYIIIMGLFIKVHFSLWFSASSKTEVCNSMKKDRRRTLRTWFNALLSCCSSFHAVFNTVVEFATLEHKAQSDANIEDSKFKVSKLRTRSGAPPDLFGVELVELRLLAVAPPQTQHLGLGAVSHVDELLVPPALVNGADVAAQDDAVVTNLKPRGAKVSWVNNKTPSTCGWSYSENLADLHEEDVAGGISAGVDNKRLLLDVTASTGPDGKLTAVLQTQNRLLQRMNVG